MSRVLDALQRHALEKPDAIAISSAHDDIAYARLWQVVEALSAELQQHGAGTAAILADNSAAWIVADLACMHAAIPLIPIPHFFSPAQIAHLLTQAGVDVCLTDRSEQLVQLLDTLDLRHEPAVVMQHSTLQRIALRADASVALPAGCAKVTFTSGSTGEPKGVCLSQTAMDQVAASLAEVTGASASDRHITLLPFATLLENIGGIYAPLLSGATVVAPGLEVVGWRGASGLDVQCFVSALTESQAATCIMIPQMLQALVAAVEQGMPAPIQLRYIAVGGAPVSLHLLERAEQLGLPVYEGYGLSEAASVVAVNVPGMNRPGSVGRPLPHVQLAFADDGEILVRGSLFDGYLGQPASLVDGYWPTGDLGYLDDEGFLHLNGRKKHIFITAFGRNVSPEWVERELSIETPIAQVCVFGEARSFNVAVIVPRPGVGQATLDSAVAAANARLPDYARISRMVVAKEPFSVQNGQWTGTGRPRRAAIEAAYRKEIDALYKE